VKPLDIIITFFSFASDILIHLMPSGSILQDIHNTYKKHLKDLPEVACLVSFRISERRIFAQTCCSRAFWGRDSLVIGGISDLRKVWYITKKRRRCSQDAAEQVQGQGESDFAITVEWRRMTPKRQNVTMKERD
jgi:hypothetical protein